MKRVIVVVLTLVLMLALTACGETATVTKEGKIVSISTTEELEEHVEQDVGETIADIQSKYESLMVKIDTYDKYLENTVAVEEFYGLVLNEINAIGIRLREYSICYVEIVMKSINSYADRYDTRGDLYDLIYEDACGDLYNEIYDDLLGDMYDCIYGGVVRDGYDYAPYDKWYDTSSEAYDMWYDCKSDVYDEWYDTKSDVFDFWYDVYGHIYDDDKQDIDEEIEKFREDIEELKETE